VHDDIDSEACRRQDDVNADRIGRLLQTVAGPNFHGYLRLWYRGSHPLTSWSRIEQRLLDRARRVAAEDSSSRASRFVALLQMRRAIVSVGAVQLRVPNRGPL
jgi:hypothetical protein